ncbi:MAG: hypothetical protein KTR25_15445 [Myxococcales bacterium]|nr:hypothetical protein [Myxococcales bacterium]
MENEHRQGAVDIAEALRDQGFEAWFAGGCVRDLLLGLSPRDWDIATDARPEQIQALFPRTIAVGAAFGVIEVIWSKKRTYEVATFRADGLYTDGRRPDAVRYATSREEDVKRRDFTINALLMDPLTGQILDYVDGQLDLEAGLIRAVGDPWQRFHEDRLRMLRAVRFAARLGFRIESQTWEALRSEAAHLRVVSPERITQELEGMWTSPRVAEAVDLLVSSHLASICLPKRCLFASMRTALARLGARETSMRLEIAWAIVHDAYPETEVEEALRHRKLSRKMIRQVRSLLRLRRDASEAQDPGEEPPDVRLLRWACREEGAALATYLACVFGDDDPSTRRFTAARRFLLDHPPATAALLTGADLQAAGLLPGPHFATLLEQIEGAVLQGRIHSRDEALLMVAQIQRQR